MIKRSSGERTDARNADNQRLYIPYPRFRGSYCNSQHETYLEEALGNHPICVLPVLDAFAITPPQNMQQAQHTRSWGASHHSYAVFFTRF
jgi:hypothetical protein